jgi:NADPH:quinone reductase
MRSVVTDPAGPSGLRVVDAPPPQPSAGACIVRVAASTLNRGEVSLIAARPNGWTPGQDVAGVIETAAPGGGPAIGARVVGLADQGAWSELVSVPADRIAVIPEGVSDADAACLGVAGLTAFRAVRRLRDLLGRAVLVTGVTGGVGTLAAQLASIAGATVTGLARNTSMRLDGVRIIDRLGEGEGDRFDRVIDAVGGEVLGKALTRLKPDARVVFFGALGGAGASFALGTFGKSPRARVEPFFLYQTGGGFGDDLAFLVGLIAAGRLKPIVARIVEREAVADAVSALKKGGVTGKIVIAAGASRAA